MYYVLDVVFTVCILHISHLSLALSLSLSFTDSEKTSVRAAVLFCGVGDG